MLGVAAISKVAPITAVHGYRKGDDAAGNGEFRQQTTERAGAAHQIITISWASA